MTKSGGLRSFGSKDIFKDAPCLMYEYSSWRHKFGKSWDRWKYENLNISRTEQNFYETKKIVNLCLRWHVLRSYWLRSWPLNSLNWIECCRPVSLRRASQVWTKTLSNKQFTTQRRAKRYCEHRLNKEGPHRSFSTSILTFWCSHWELFCESTPEIWNVSI